MKIAKTVLLDQSDQKVFPITAKHGEWAVTGTFLFTDIDPTECSKKQQIAFRDGWLGIDTFGFSTFVQITTLSPDHKENVNRQLSTFIYETFAPPGMLYAIDAAKKELDDMIWLINDRIGEMYEQIESMEMSIVGLGMEMHKLYGYKS